MASVELLRKLLSAETDREQRATENSGQQRTAGNSASRCPNASGHLLCQLSILLPGGARLCQPQNSLIQGRHRLVGLVQP